MKIQDISIWNNGIDQIANNITAQIDFDNLKDQARFFYYLGGDQNTNITSGYVEISGADYISWGESTDVNLAAYEYIANQLGLTLIP